MTAINRAGGENIIETDRLNLRRFIPEDDEFIYSLLNSPGWLKNIGTRNIQTAEDARNYITEKLMPSYGKFGFGFWRVGLKPENLPVGMCGIIKRDGLDDVDLGFALLPEHERKGYAIEASEAVLNYAKSKFKLNKVAAITIPENTGSINILKKCGMEFEKMVRLREDEEELMLFSVTFREN